MCSLECESKLPEAEKGYVQFPHKGGSNLKQPTYEEWEKANTSKFIEVKYVEKQTKNDSQPKLFKLIRKIWEK